MSLFEIMYYTLFVLAAFFLISIVYNVIQLIRFARTRSRDSKVPKYTGKRK